MAEAAVVSTLINKFTPMVSRILNFRKDFEYVRDQLSDIKSLLTDAGDKRNKSSVSTWVDSLEDFVDDAEYLVEECEQCGAVDNIFAKLIFRLKMCWKIRVLRVRLEQIQRNAQNLKLIKDVLGGQVRDESQNHRSYAVPPELQIVGMSNDIKVITEWILKEGSPQVIAIVGMGGQGKTLLLKRIFRLPEIRQHFDHLVLWEISQKFNDKELLRQFLREVEPNHKIPMELSREDLIYGILKKLEGKRCLFALDDVWNEHFWDEIGFHTRTQDKVVLTTRHKDIARYLAGDHILPIERLSEENSWQLFCLHAFPDGGHHCPSVLYEIAHKIVNKCGRLPLAIKTIGAYLRLKGGHSNDWEWTLNHLNEAHGMSDRVMSSLKISYEALSPELKLCFLYCSAFPKNTNIQSENLVYAWIAQGFVSAELEESYSVGRSYMVELIDRCLIEVSEVGDEVGDGGVQSCKMHDLLHDLAVSEQTKCLLKPGGQLERIPAEECQGLRRISLMKNEISTIQNGIRCPGLRSLLLSHNSRLTSISSTFFKNMRYLCVLDLSDTSITTLPDIGNLRLLKYLNLSHTFYHQSITSLPDSIGNLRLLEYLNLSHASITSLPDSIGDLRLLKYLNLSGTKIEKLPESLSGLRHLQFLDVSETHITRLHSGIDKHKYMLHLNLGSWLKDCSVGISKLIYLKTLKGVRITVGNAATANALQLRDLKGLTLLQHLSLHIETNKYYDHYQVEDEGTFRGMTKMRTLYVQNHSGGSLHLPTDMEAMERLEIVCLHQCAVPKWIFQLQYLMKLSLSNSNADFRGLEKIPNLKKLHLQYNQNPGFIEFPNEFGEAGAFLKLEKLVIGDFTTLKSIPSFHEDAMPRLRCLRMDNCKQVENMPEGLTKLKNLKEVEVEMWVPSVENFSYGKRHCWQSLKDRQIKIKVEVRDGFNILRVM